LNKICGPSGAISTEIRERTHNIKVNTSLPYAVMQFSPFTLFEFDFEAFNRRRCGSKYVI
jgi:hypothetical protein